MSGLGTGYSRFVALALAVGLSFAAATSAPAASFVVDSAADTTDASPGDGTCDDGGGACTLRAAIQETNALAGADTITLPAGTYTLTIAGTGENAAATGDLDIADDLVLTGAGALATTVDAAGIDRVFNVLSGTTVGISGVTITGGGGVSLGGGVLSTGSTFTLSTALVQANASTSNGGGMAFNGNGVVAVRGSAVTGNSASSRGGGLQNGTGTSELTVVNSTISTNTAANGAGLFASGSTEAVLINTTISNNTATGSGGGMDKAGPALVSQLHTIVAGNSAPSNADCDGLPTSSLGFNIVGTGTGCTVGGSDLTIAPATVFTTLLSPLSNNGGPTPTHALLAGGLAIDAGDPINDCEDELAAPLTQDQRGEPRPVDGDGNATATCDVGAFEFSPTHVPSLSIAGLAMLATTLGAFAIWPSSRRGPIANSLRRIWSGRGLRI